MAVSDFLSALKSQAAALGMSEEAFFQAEILKQSSGTTSSILVALKAAADLAGDVSASSFFQSQIVQTHTIGAGLGGAPPTFVVVADNSLTDADVGKLIENKAQKAAVYQMTADVPATPVVWTYTATTISNVDIPAIPQVDAFADYVFPGQPDPEDTLAYVDGASVLHDISIAGVNFDIGVSVSATIDNAVTAISSTVNAYADYVFPGQPLAEDTLAYVDGSSVLHDISVAGINFDIGTTVSETIDNAVTAINAASVQAYAEWVFPVQPISGDVLAVTTGSGSNVALAMAGTNFSIGATVADTIDSAVSYINANFTGGGGIDIFSAVRLSSPDRLRVTLASSGQGGSGGADGPAGNTYRLGFTDPGESVFQGTNPRINTNLVDATNHFRNGHARDANITASHLTSPERLRITLGVDNAGNTWQLGFDPNQLGTFSGTNAQINTSLLTGSNFFRTGHSVDPNFTVSHLTAPERLRIQLTAAGVLGNAFRLGFDPSQVGTFSGTNPRINTSLLDGSNHFTNGVDGVPEIFPTTFTYQDAQTGFPVPTPGIAGFDPGVTITAGIDWTPGVTLNADVAIIAATMLSVWVATNPGQSPVISHLNNIITIARGITGSGAPPPPPPNTPPFTRGNFINFSGSDLPFVEGTNDVPPFSQAVAIGTLTALVGSTAFVSSLGVGSAIASEAISSNMPVSGANNGQVKNQNVSNGDLQMGVSLVSAAQGDLVSWRYTT